MVSICVRDITVKRVVFVIRKRWLVGFVETFSGTWLKDLDNLWFVNEKSLDESGGHGSEPLYSYRVQLPAQVSDEGSTDVGFKRRRKKRRKEKEITPLASHFSSADLANQLASILHIYTYIQEFTITQLLLFVICVPLIVELVYKRF